MGALHSLFAQNLSFTQKLENSLRSEYDELKKLKLANLKISIGEHKEEFDLYGLKEVVAAKESMLNFFRFQKEDLSKNPEYINKKYSPDFRFSLIENNRIEIKINRNLIKDYLTAQRVLNQVEQRALKYLSQNKARQYYPLRFHLEYLGEVKVYPELKSATSLSLISRFSFEQFIDIGDGLKLRINVSLNNNHHIGRYTPAFEHLVKSFLSSDNNLNRRVYHDRSYPEFSFDIYDSAIKLGLSYIILRKSSDYSLDERLGMRLAFNNNFQVSAPIFGHSSKCAVGDSFDYQTASGDLYLDFDFNDSLYLDIDLFDLTKVKKGERCSAW